MSNDPDGETTRTAAPSPGPWRSGRQDMVSYTALEGEDGGPWKNIYWKDPAPRQHLGRDLPSVVARAYGRDEDEVLANARLIAAAPELAASLTLLATGVQMDAPRAALVEQAALCLALLRRIQGTP